MAEKRFWSGAILAVTIVIAGASSLPALLLGPTAREPMPAAPVTKIDRPASIPVAAKLVEFPANTPDLPVAIAAATADPARVPQPVARSESVPVTPVRETAPVGFPPVQPVGIAEPEAADPQAATAPPKSLIPDRRPPAKMARAERNAPHATKRKRNVVRPALYPIRDFFAWRR